MRRSQSFAAGLALLFLLLAPLGHDSARAMPSPLPPSTRGEVGPIQEIIREKTGMTPGAVRVVGDWALCDEVGEDPARKARFRAGQVLLQRLPAGWFVKAELAGPGLATVEALAWHEVPDKTILRLVERADREAMKPVLKYLHQVLRGEYPNGYLMENIALAENWAFCGYRGRMGAKKSDFMGQALLRRTRDTWHLVEQSGRGIELDRYGVPPRIRRQLTGEL